ncbi:MAG: bifunctional DNA-formamidopyrimidine glycosylase/DNA-(apurinic or apyrimidinic site) lyase [Sinobacterium sp.]|nr:bifunctional DNA-formamidopyrimidine glycosylase/DNA-(apurinic or apyrimidinic site) lyase [Sinobacterium sp.]
MPELPEVETSTRGIRPHIEGKTLARMVIRRDNLRWAIPKRELCSLEGERLLSVTRRGKYIVLAFNSGSMLIHLGMSGNVRIVDASTEVAKHDHIDAVFDNGKALRLNDPRRFGCWLYTNEPVEQHDLIKKLGPEPLTDDFTLEYFWQRSRGKKQAVKTWLMDSNMVVGVGNIYACESLFMSKINPKTEAGKISKKRLERLHSTIRQVLSAAIEQGGTTLKDFVGSDGKPGYFKQELHVYGRAGDPCMICHKAIKKIIQGQRSTFYCENCQKT